MQLTTRGKILEIFPTQEITPTFKKREFVIQTDDQYPQTYKMEFRGDKCDILDNYKIRDTVECNVNVVGTTWLNPRTDQTVYFTTLICWKITKIVQNNSKSKSPSTSNQFPEVKVIQMEKPNVEYNDDLPF